MTEQERYLITFLNETFGHHESDIDSEAFAKRLIQRYPQILAEKVWEGEPELGVQVDLLDVLYDLKDGKKISIYVKDEE